MTIVGQDRLLECSFLIPEDRDALLSDGRPHSDDAWNWLDAELFVRFGGGTCAPGKYAGFYRDPDTAERVDDESLRFIVAVAESEVEQLRGLLSAACVIFQQKCIYLNIAGTVEFIEAPAHEQE